MFPWGMPGELEQARRVRSRGRRDLLTAITARGLMTPGEAIQIATTSGHGVGKSRFGVLDYPVVDGDVRGHRGRGHGEYRDAAADEDVGAVGEVVQAVRRELHVPDDRHGDLRAGRSDTSEHGASTRFPGR